MFVAPTDSIIISNFSTNSNLSNWFIVNDVVMGGKSDSGIFLNGDDYAIFKGFVSLANNGGFAMVKHVFKPVKVKSRSKIVMKVKGDRKSYQFRLKSDLSQPHSYVRHFSTNGEWQIIEMNLDEFYASFRGRKLNIPNFDFEQISEIAFLIGNKRAEEFQLQIKWIALK